MVVNTISFPSIDFHGFNRFVQKNAWYTFSEMKILRKCYSALNAIIKGLHDSVQKEGASSFPCEKSPFSFTFALSQFREGGQRKQTF